MKDIIKRVIISMVSWGLIGYLGFLVSKGSIIVWWQYLDYNNLYYILLLVVCVYLFIFFWIYPIHIKMTKATLFVSGLALIVIWDTVLVNNPEAMVYVADIFKLVWVILTLLAWTNILVTNKVQDKAKKNNIEIIEV